MVQDMNRINELSDKLRALSHPHRLCIVRDLLDHAANVTSIQQQLGIPQPSVSAHLSRLRTAGIISGSRSGQQIRYQVVDADTRALMSRLLD
jgi:ArsR family transcriptional regulator